jgi:hypothetical protein
MSTPWAVPRNAPVSKETYCRGKRDLLYKQRRPLVSLAYLGSVEHVYIYTHTHTHTHTHTYSYIHIYIYIYIYIHLHIYTYTHIHIYT